MLDEQSQVRFAVGGYDTSRPLVIDPTLAYSTYLGGSGSEQGQGNQRVAADAPSTFLRTSSNQFVTTMMTGSVIRRFVKRNLLPSRDTS